MYFSVENYHGTISILIEILYLCFFVSKRGNKLTKIYFPFMLTVCKCWNFMLLLTLGDTFLYLFFKIPSKIREFIHKNSKSYLCILFGLLVKSVAPEGWLEKVQIHFGKFQKTDGSFIIFFGLTKPIEITIIKKPTCSYVDTGRGTLIN